MELTFLFAIILVFAAISFISWLISRKVFRTLSNRNSNDAKLISAIIFLVSFLVILVALLYVLDLSHVFDKFKYGR